MSLAMTSTVEFGGLVLTDHAYWLSVGLVHKLVDDPSYKGVIPVTFS